MKFTNYILSSIFILGPVLSQNVDALEGLETLNKAPHSIQIGGLLNKRDVRAELDGVTDSDSIPIEDQVQNSKLSTTDSSSISTTNNIKSSKSQIDTTNSIESSKIIKTNEDDSKKEDPNSKSPLFMAISMIVVSEIGDKTFLISALMAMRHSRILVFTASFASLAVMTVLSGIVGHALPTLISQRVTQFLASFLFIVFGFKLTKEGLEMSKDLGVEEELAEVEEELEVTDINHELNDLESNQRNRRPSNPNIERDAKLINTAMENFKSLCGLILDPVWIQVFIMIFLGEWGDRSQIATIAMAAGSDYWSVISGAVIGHGLCTAAAVIGGKMLASRISMRTVTLGGAFAFFVFAILYFVEAWNNTDA
ncbi:Transmembrane protein [Wickerhamomyces ciferrii]|uniref:GDT1 family protein n=1 Tax=Wickerhamomyces ciferrii (strain ATCC 14091 / BCRC 22168 / CBS 111 / JCM 3599 / NBRC 0793 / NRRL Y-1031 F-60-10) TaxID=1206466 RepID=K0KP36_WICCF|nr:Transmembrane protein [Wickerhamomyces ciferrii]CCH44716.1 Transmembrane protein [Wickerhamomyces ciferrii]